MTAFDRNYLEKLTEAVPRERHEAMSASYATFERLEEPTGAEEDWRYVDYDLPFSGLSPAVDPGKGLDSGEFLNSITERSGSVLVVDGHVISVDGGQHLTRIGEQSWSSPVPPDHNKLAAAAAAFAHDGVVIDLPDGAVVRDPVVIDVQGVTEDTASFPVISIRLGTNAEASVVVVYRSAESKRLLIVPTVDIEVGAGANLRLVSVQNLDHAASAVVHQRVKIDRDGTSRLGEVGLGGRLGRLDLGVDLHGDGSSSDVVGLYFGEGSQTLDYRMVINHSGKNTSSDVFLKGAVEDDAQSVFTGLLRIEKDAQKTSTFETNRNLVLSENAKAHSVPNLEILCDDVVCGHGSSVGPLEEEHLYYLQSRGISRERAERMLIRGFFTEVVDRLPVSGLSQPVTDEVFARFVSAQEEGRVA